MTGNLTTRSGHTWRPTLRSWLCAVIVASHQCCPAEEGRPIVQAANAAGLKLFAQAFPPGQNGSLAPLAVTSALAMLHAGAQDNTEEQLRAFLVGDREAGLVAEYADLLAGLPQRPAGAAEAADRLTFAQGLWVQQGFPISASFQQHVRDRWHTGVEVLDFHAQPGESRAAIEAWFRQQDPLLEGTSAATVTDQTRLFLAATASLRAAWLGRFEDAGQGDFHRGPEETIKAPYMRLTLPIPYWRGPGLTAVRIPFRWPGLGIVIVVPEDAATLANTEADLVAGRLPFESAQFERRQVALRLVKFRHRFGGVDLRSALRNVGVEDLFTREARLRGIGPNLFLDTLDYGSTFALDENGCQAAAAASLNLVLKSEPTPFVTDRPFLYFVLDEERGLVLFVGRVQDPHDQGDWRPASRRL